MAELPQPPLDPETWLEQAEDALSYEPLKGWQLKGMDLSTALSRLLDMAAAQELDEWTRVRALEVLVDLAPPDAGDRLVALFEDPDEEVRLAALRAASASGGPDVRRRLLELVDAGPPPPEEVGESAGSAEWYEALRGLQHFPDDAVARRLADLLDSGCPISGAIMDAVKANGSRVLTEPLARRYLERTDAMRVLLEADPPDVHRGFRDGLGWQLGADLDLLGRALLPRVRTSDELPVGFVDAVRYNLLNAYGDLEHEDDTLHSPRAAAARMLPHLVPAEMAVAALRGVWGNSGFVPEIRRVCVDVLAGLGHPAGRAALEEMLGLVEGWPEAGPMAEYIRRRLEED